MLTGNIDARCTSSPPLCAYWMLCLPLSYRSPALLQPFAVLFGSHCFYLMDYSLYLPLTPVKVPPPPECHGVTSVVVQQVVPTHR